MKKPRANRANYFIALSTGERLTGWSPVLRVWSKDVTEPPHFFTNSVAMKVKFEIQEEMRVKDHLQRVMAPTIVHVKTWYGPLPVSW